MEMVTGLAVERKVSKVRGTKQLTKVKDKRNKALSLLNNLWLAVVIITSIWLAWSICDVVIHNTSASGAEQISQYNLISVLLEKTK